MAIKFIGSDFPFFIIYFFDLRTFDKQMESDKASRGSKTVIVRITGRGQQNTNKALDGILIYPSKNVHPCGLVCEP